MASAELYWDPFDYALHADRRRLREEAPLYYSKLPIRARRD